MFFLQWKKHKETNNINKIKWMNTDNLQNQNRVNKIKRRNKDNQ